jgi:hypothetical protein
MAGPSLFPLSRPPGSHHARNPKTNLRVHRLRKHDNISHPVLFISEHDSAAYLRKRIHRTISSPNAAAEARQKGICRSARAACAESVENPRERESRFRQGNLLTDVQISQLLPRSHSRTDRLSRQTP